jgi:ABC-type transporter Mla maintaining outer membrane lipid asymmetry ATPase subunit MlaF
MNGDAIKMDNIDFKYGHLKVIDNISLCIAKGTSFGYSVQTEQVKPL